MEFGGIFILLVLLVVVATLGGGVYAVAMWLRHKQLDPDGNKVAGNEDDRRPEHHEVGGDRPTRFVGTP